MDDFLGRFGKKGRFRKGRKESAPWNSKKGRKKRWPGEAMSYRTKKSDR